MELRNISCQYQVLERADGSCRWKQGDTEVLVGVFGPIEPKGFGRNDAISKADLKIFVFPLSGPSTPYTTTLQHYLQNAFQEVILLSLHPRTQIQITVHILHDDGSVSTCFLVFQSFFILP